MIYTITLKTKWYGNFSTFDREFKNDRHFINWCNFMTKRGHKVIGTYLKTSAKHRKEVQLDHTLNKIKQKRKFNI